MDPTQYLINCSSIHGRFFQKIRLKLREKFRSYCMNKKNSMDEYIISIQLCWQVIRERKEEKDYDGQVEMKKERKKHNSNFFYVSFLEIEVST